MKLETYEECLCFYSLIGSGFKRGDSSTYDQVYSDDSVQRIAQVGSYYGVDGIAEYLPFVAGGEFVSTYNEVGMALF